MLHNHQCCRLVSPAVRVRTSRDLSEFVLFLDPPACKSGESSRDESGSEGRCKSFVFKSSCFRPRRVDIYSVESYVSKIEQSLAELEFRAGGVSNGFAMM